MSSAWLIMVRPRWEAMAKAFAITLPDCTPLPSSVMNFRSSGRVLRWSRVWPSKFSVILTVWFAPHRPTRPASAITLWAMSAEEQTGFVLGIRFTKV